MKTIVLSFRTTEAGNQFVNQRASELGWTKAEVMKRMFTYAATHMKSEDWKR